MNEISSKRYFENKSYQQNIKTKPPNLVMRKEGFYSKLFFYTEDEIAERMEITQQAVSQIYKGIKKKMAKYKRLTQGLDLPRFLRIKFEKM